MADEEKKDDTTAPPPAPTKAKPAPAASPVASLGGGVHFVLDGEAASIGTHRPAVILAVAGDTLDVVVFTSPEDGPRYAAGVAHRAEVPHDEETKRPGTWHWPE